MSPQSKQMLPIMKQHTTTMTGMTWLSCMHGGQDQVYVCLPPGWHCLDMSNRNLEATQRHRVRERETLATLVGSLGIDRKDSWKSWQARTDCRFSCKAKRRNKCLQNLTKYDGDPDLCMTFPLISLAKEELVGQWRNGYPIKPQNSLHVT